MIVPLEYEIAELQRILADGLLIPFFQPISIFGYAPCSATRH